jgi:hypothetical protein
MRPRKTILTILLPGLLLCGCLMRQTSSNPPAIDRIQAGNDSAWNGGSFVLSVAKRNGRSLEGIQITQTAANGLKTITTADTGTVSPGSSRNATDKTCVRITLHNAKCQNAGGQTTAEEMVIALRE